MTCHAARYRQGHERKPRSRGGHQDRRQPLLRPTQDEPWPERLALFALEVLEVADHQDPVPSRDAEHGQKPYQRAQREDASTQPHCEHSSNQRHRQGKKEQQSQSQTPEGSLQEEQDHQRYGDPVDQQTLLGSGKLTPAMFSSTALTAEPRSLPSTLAPTSIRRDCWVRSMALGVGARRTSATCSRGICSPPGVSIGSSRMLAALWRVSGVLQTCTSYALPPWKMSPTSSLATNVAAWRRTSPGLMP